LRIGESRDSWFDASHRPGNDIERVFLCSPALVRSALPRFIRQLAQAIPAQTVLAGDRHGQEGGFLRTPAGGGQAAVEFESARRTGEAAGSLIS
jgi:hypothetical protein